MDARAGADLRVGETGGWSAEFRPCELTSTCTSSAGPRGSATSVTVTASPGASIVPGLGSTSSTYPGSKPGRSSVKCVDREPGGRELGSIELSRVFVLMTGDAAVSGHCYLVLDNPDPCEDLVDALLGRCGCTVGRVLRGQETVPLHCRSMGTPPALFGFVQVVSSRSAATPSISKSSTAVNMFRLTPCSIHTLS